MIYTTEITTDDEILQIHKMNQLYLRSNVSKQVQEEESRNTKNSGQFHLQLSVAVASKFDFIVSYITQNAFWTPYYDIRVEDIKSPLKVIYKAKITQTTGIDWKKVKLSLSSSLATQNGVAPLLRSWFLSYINPVTAMEKEWIYSGTYSIQK